MEIKWRTQKETAKLIYKLLYYPHKDLYHTCPLLTPGFDANCDACLRFMELPREYVEDSGIDPLIFSAPCPCHVLGCEEAIIKASEQLRKYGYIDDEDNWIGQARLDYFANLLSPALRSAPLLTKISIRRKQ